MGPRFEILTLPFAFLFFILFYFVLFCILFYFSFSNFFFITFSFWPLIPYHSGRCYLDGVYMCAYVHMCLAKLAYLGYI